MRNIGKVGAVLLLVWGCFGPRPIHVALAPSDGMSRPPVFLLASDSDFSSPAQPTAITVRTCLGSDLPNKVVWFVSSYRPTPSKDPLPFLRQIEYGVLPNGWVERVPAEPLAPGCYDVVVWPTDRPGDLRFIVHGDGALETVDPLAEIT